MEPEKLWRSRIAGIHQVPHIFACLWTAATATCYAMKKRRMSGAWPDIELQSEVSFRLARHSGTITDAAGTARSPGCRVWDQVTAGIGREPQSAGIVSASSANLSSWLVLHSAAYGGDVPDPQTLP